jgi:hypothetical protein
VNAVAGEALGGLGIMLPEQQPAVLALPTRGPKIFYVTPVYSVLHARSTYIVISGIGFGTNPSIESAGGGNSGSDTVKSSTIPSLGIADPSENWEAGGDYTYSGGITVDGYTFGSGIQPNYLGVFVVSWSNNAIVLGGFGNYLGTPAALINHGDKLLFVVWSPNNSGYAFYVATYLGPNV